MKLVRLALNVPLNRFFDYLLPDDMQAVIGARAVVPFGRQEKVGIIIGFPETSDVPTEKLKPVVAMLDNQSLFDAEIWRLLSWAANYYHAPLGEVLTSALPVKLRNGDVAKKTQPDYYRLTELGRKALQNNALQRSVKQRELLESLAKFTDFFEKPTACNASAWKAIREKQFIESIEQVETQSWQQALGNEAICNSHNRLTLNKAQTLAVSRMQYHEGFGVFLLNGITGSGKTEVYLQLIETVLNKGKQVLVLVPEIGLTPQTVHRFQSRFNVQIDVLHSNLNDSQRLNAWLRAKQGESAIVIGTRSALLTQFTNLGLIVIDEEHDSSFKQQDGWRYNARDLAIVRAKHLAIPIVLGSATPSLESLYNVDTGKFIALSLTQRAGNAKNVQQQVIDLRKQRVNAGLSEQLIIKMQQHLAQGNQVMLFLNRRGFAPAILCHECGWLCQCSDCDKPFTYHQKQRILRCHHCGTQKVLPRQCEHCGSTNLITTGVGTEQLEQVLQQRFPEYNVSRIDRDSTTRKGALEKHLTDINQGKSQILIGTQMLAKGHHFPNVTLVAIVNVDSALFSTDFRAEERLAQLYVQVAGRAGRAEKQGEVILQTHYPDHPLLKTLLSDGYLAFAKQALQTRQAMNLPPFTSQVLIRATGKDNEKITKLLENLTACLQDIAQQFNIQCISMMNFAAPMAKKAGLYRQLLLVQHDSRITLQKLFSEFDHYKDYFLKNDVRLSVDIDPQEIS